MTNIVTTSGRKRKRIVFSGGFWWLLDPQRERVVRLDPMFRESKWNVSSLCGTLEIGYRTFARLVEDSLGITVKVWLRQIRIVSACHRLREGCKINSLAQQMGFRYESDFAREFKKLVGVSPSFYMKSEYSRSHGIRRNLSDNDGSAE